MIGKLTGKVDDSGEDWVILDVGGVGYEVHCSSRTLQSLPAKGEQVSLAIETHVREQEIRLFGFADLGERAWFRLLQGVQGVGAKLALAILGTLSPNDLANAIALQDKAMVSRTPGVGPKVAGRITSELKDKAAALGAPGSVVPAEVAAAAASPSSAVADAISALANLGYAQAQAANAVAAALEKTGRGADEARAEELIRLGLKELAG